MTLKKYDVIIVGGGTAGVSCAYNSAKRGLKTLIIEKNSYLGGSITSSLVIPAMKTSDNAINNDFYNLLYKRLHDLGGAIKYGDGNIGWFNPELIKIVLDSLMQEVGVDVLFESRIKDFKHKNNKILSVYIDSEYTDNDLALFDFPQNMLSVYTESKYFVDATGDANFCEKISCNFLENFENESQPINLRFILSGIDVKKFSQWLMNYDKDREVTTSYEIDGHTYLSTAYTWDTTRKWALSPLFEQAIKDNIITVEDSNYFQMFSVAGTADSIAFNAPRMLKKYDNRSKAYIDGRASILRLTNFCKKYLAGFENAYISSIANTLGIRVSKRVKGKYIYTYQDLINGKKFETPVVQSNYPVDIHSDKKNNSVLQKVFQDYQLPIESLIADKYSNVYVIGRCISADFKSQAALRIIPSCFSMGEGLAKYLAKLN